MCGCKIACVDIKSHVWMLHHMCRCEMICANVTSHMCTSDHTCGSEIRCVNVRAPVWLWDNICGCEITSPDVRSHVWMWDFTCRMIFKRNKTIINKQNDFNNIFAQIIICISIKKLYKNMLKKYLFLVFVNLKRNNFHTCLTFLYTNFKSYIQNHIK